MTQPTQYTPTTDFSQQEAINASGRSTVNTAALDTEFANVATTLGGLVSNIALLQRDDGRLADLSVEVRCLSQDVLTLMGGFNLRGLWADATDYAVNDICSSGDYTYCCTTAHTSSGSIDLTKWIQFGFTSGADAAQAAAAAQTSATAAAGSATAAANSATSASNSATTATNAASIASGHASTATLRANAAANSATSAANSATAAAASASSGGVSSVAGRTGAVTLTKADVGLGNVDNTADDNKPFFGVGQTWQSVTRSNGVTYYNTTGRPITLNSFLASSSDIWTKASISINGEASFVYATTYVPGGGYAAGSVVIPPGASYVVTISGGSHTAVELR